MLESEIKQDAGKGNTEKKEEELAELKAKAQSATAAQMSTLADANKSVEEAAKADNSNTEGTATKNNTEKSEKNTGSYRGSRGDRQRKEYGYQKGNTGDSRNTDSGKCTECNTTGSIYTD